MTQTEFLISIRAISLHPDGGGGGGGEGGAAEKGLQKIPGLFFFTFSGLVDAPD